MRLVKHNNKIFFNNIDVVLISWESFILSVPPHELARLVLPLPAADLTPDIILEDVSWRICHGNLIAEMGPVSGCSAHEAVTASGI